MKTFFLTLVMLSAPAMAATLTPELHTESSQSPRKWQLVAGAATAVVSVPVGIFVGGALGTVSNNLYAALIPGVLAWALIPAVAVSVVELVVGNSLSPGSSKLSPAIFAAVGANLAIVVVSILLGADARGLAHLSLITLVSALVLPSVTTGVMAATAPQPEANLSFRETPLLPRVPTFTIYEVAL